MYSDWIITKRQVGIALLLAGVLGAVGILLLDALRGGGDFGPSQKLAVVACVALAIFSLTIIALGDRPA
ncbi:MAG: hypothetical protein U0528_11100 [Anaerolineae bacterium]|nr:hypothetical protein [Anaerolineae bacterium]